MARMESAIAAYMSGVHPLESISLIGAPGPYCYHGKCILIIIYMYCMS